MTLFKTEDSVFNFWDLMALIQSAWPWVFCGGLCGLAISLGLIFFVPAQYEATGVIQPATIGIISANSSASSKGVEVESAAQTLERMKLATFYSDNMTKICDIEETPNSRQALSSAIKANLVKGNSLISLSYRAKSPETAMACLNAVIVQLSDAQAAIAEPIIHTLEEQRTLTRQQLNDAESIQAQIEKRAMILDTSDSKFSASVLMLGASLSKREEIARLRKLHTEQTLQLSPPLTQPVMLLEPIYASEQPVSPNKILYLVNGLVGGFLVGCLALIIYNSWKHYRNQ